MLSSVQYPSATGTVLDEIVNGSILIFGTEGDSAMFRRALAIMISGLLLSSVLGYPPARAQAQEANRSAEKARAAVQKLGVSPKRRVEVKLLDGTRMKGSISAAGGDTFTVTDSKTGAPRTVAYADVARVKEPGAAFRRGRGSSSGQRRSRQ
jgi:hypothetical protein